MPKTGSAAVLSFGSVNRVQVSYDRKLPDDKFDQIL